MSYDPHDYIVDSRRLGAGVGLAGAVVLGLLVISCPATSEGTGLPQEASLRQIVRPMLPGECQSTLASIDPYVQTSGCLAS